MTFTHALTQNNYGPCKFVVATSSANGTHTTLASAMAVASSGDTIFLRDSVTENVTITPGVNIVGWQGTSANMPSITGKLTMTGAGTSTISGLTLITNSDFAIAVTGSSASILRIKNCYLNFSNNTGISFTTSSSSAFLVLEFCEGQLGTTGIAYHSMSSAGILSYFDCVLGNSGNSTTASNNSSGIVSLTNTNFPAPISTSSTGAFQCFHSVLDTSGQNATALTTAGTATSASYQNTYSSGTASCVSVGAGTTLGMSQDVVNSSNTNAITGAGTLSYGTIDFVGTSDTINTTTQSNVNSGTFTPVLKFGGGTTGITYSVQSGKYYRSGNVVYILVEITLTSKGSSTGMATITGLPFTSASSPATYELFSAYINMTAATATYWSSELVASASVLTPIFGVASTGGFNTTTDANWQNGSIARIQGFYYI